jgi:hypothetical protein
VAFDVDGVDHGPGATTSSNLNYRMGVHWSLLFGGAIVLARSLATA